MAVKNQLDWEIEENTIICLMELSKIPLIAPIIADEIKINTIQLLRFKLVMSHNGAIFCQDKEINSWGQLKFSVSWGSHIWKGAAAILIKRAKKIKIGL